MEGVATGISSVWLHRCARVPPGWRLHSNYPAILLQVVLGMTRVVTVRVHCRGHPTQTNAPMVMSVLSQHPIQKLLTPTPRRICDPSRSTEVYFPSGSDGKAPVYNVGDLGSIPGSGRSPGEGNGNPLQYYCLKKSHGQGSLVGYSPWGHKESDTTEQLHFHFH